MKPPHSKPQSNNHQEDRRAFCNENVKKTNSYCHFFSNFGECHYERKSGRKCKYDHVKAPKCNYDGSYTRKKCIFSHSFKQQTPPGFSEQNSQNYQQTPFLHQGMGMGGFQTPTQVNFWQPFAQMMQHVMGNQGKTNNY